MALTTEQFREQLIASDLLRPEDVASILSSLPPDRQPKDGEQFARELVRQKILTRYQAEQIYSGKGKALVLGNYVVLDLLGQGGMGVVLKAEHKRLKRLVALKVMSANIVSTPDALKRFHREVEAAAKLRHINVVATDDADEAKGTHFLVMEFVEGSDLSALVRKKGPLSVSQALHCIVQAARGLEFAHSQGVVHRDIKPANLLLDSTGTVKILDMGLARIEGDSGSQSELTSTGAVMGTVDYMAPEQARSTKHADARSDIYSLGISLWYLLTGRCAYEGNTLMAKLLAHRDAPIPSLCHVNPDIPASVDAVFRKMVAKQANDRYQSMTEVIRDLEACQSSSFSGTSGAMLSSIEDPDLQSFLSGLGGPSSNAPTRLATAKPAGVRVNAASEPTMINGNVGVNTDPETMTSVQAEERQKRKRQPQKTTQGIAPPPHRNLRVLLGGAAAVIGLLIAVIILIQTPHGTLQLEILDPEVEVTIKGTELTLSGTDIEPISLKTGEKKLLITRGDLSFETDSFTLKKGMETRVKVELVSDKLIVNGDGRVIAEQPIQRRGGPTLITEKDSVSSNSTMSNGIATPPRPAADRDASAGGDALAGNEAWDTPEFRQWLSEVKDLPARKLLEAVERKMAELNPGFDGKLSHVFTHIPGASPVIEGGRVVEVGFSSQRVSDISPIRAFGKLRALSCAGSSNPAQQPSSLIDISPLRGMEIERLAVCWNQKLSDISPVVWPGLRELLAFDSKVTDLTPLRGTPLRRLLVDFSGVVDLSPLEGMPLEELGISGASNSSGITDLSPLRGMKLRTLEIAQNRNLVDISPLAGMPLNRLVATDTKIESLEPLRGMKLLQLSLIKTRVTDLSPLTGMPLQILELASTPVSDLTPLQGIPLTNLQLLDCDDLRDCSPLKGMPLKEVYLEFEAERDTEWLRSLPKLERINGKPVAEFWKEVANR